MKLNSKIINIESVEYIKDYILYLSVSDGIQHKVDLSLFIKKSRHPEVQKFLNPKQFKRFKLIHGQLMWGDFDFIFPLIDL